MADKTLSRSNLLCILIFILVIIAAITNIVIDGNSESSRERLQRVEELKTVVSSLRFDLIRSYGTAHNLPKRQKEIRKIVKDLTQRDWRQFAEKRDYNEVERVYLAVVKKYEAMDRVRIAEALKELRK